MKPALLLALLVVAAPVRASDKPLRLKGGSKAEDALRKFVSSDPRLKAKISDAMKRENVFLAEIRDADMRDAVADSKPAAEDLKQKIAEAPAAERPRLLDQLPGVRPATVWTCASLAECAEPPMSVEAVNSGDLPDAIRAAVRPWMLLQQGRRSELLVETARGEGDAALNLTLKGIETGPLTLNVAPRMTGGFRVWFDKPEGLTDLYARERAAVLNPGL